ncbi:Clavaminate synthase-like protein [Aspergillus floccosus]
MGIDTVKTYFGDLQVEPEVIQGDFDNLPIIDVASLDSPDIEARKQLAAQIFDACTRVGFFYITNHGIPSGTIDAVHSAARQFFALPEGQKLECFLGKSNRFHGYSPLGGEHSDKELFGEQTNLSESFDIGYDIECDPDKSCTDRLPPDMYKLYGGNLWPSPDVLPGFKETYIEYFKACLCLSRKLMRIFALALGLEEDYFVRFVTFPGCISRILHYPPQPVPGEKKVGIEAHTDYECFTILSQDEVPALQVLNTRRQWVNAPPLPGTLVVNIGDFLAFWTDGNFRSTVHRATNLTGQDRYSIPFFFGVNYDATIEVLETCRKGATGKSVKAGEYVRERLSKSYIPFGQKPPTTSA